MSIRVTGDGQYFYASADAAAIRLKRADGAEAVRWELNDAFGDLSRFGAAEITVEADRAMLVPAEAADGVDDPGKFFAAMSKKVPPGESIVKIGSGDKVLLAAVDEKFIGEIKNLLSGMAVNLTHPLLKGVEYACGNRSMVYVYTTDEASFFVVKTGERLLHADSLPVSDFAAVLLNVNRLIVANKLGKILIVCGGSDERLKEKLAEYFPEVVAHG